MNINLTRPGQWCAGLGDCVTWAWIANGANVPVGFVANGANAELLKLFGQQVVSDERGMDPTPCYQRELNERGHRPRVTVWAEQLGFSTVATRPQFEGARPYTPKPRRIILCPQSHFRCRTWPAFYWIDLNWTLIQYGFEVVFCLESETGEFANRGPSMAYWGIGFRQIADLYLSADLVISNDAFPAHFAGTLGVKSLALCGPTKETCFAHIPEVTTLHSQVALCTGCHFGRPYRDVCDIGCQALYTLLPDHVLTTIRAITEGTPNAAME